MISYYKDNNNLTHFTLYHKESGASADIIPALGGMVHGIMLLPKNSSGKTAIPVLMSDREDEILNNPIFRGRILFPFNDRIPDGKYRFNGKVYYFPINDNKYNDAIHGFLYRKSLELVKDSKVLTIKYTTEDEPGYPFKASIVIDYRITAFSFTLSIEITNLDAKDIPAACGWHSYFYLPGVPLNRLFLNIPADKYMEVNKKLLPTGRFPTVKGTHYDFREPTELKKSSLDIGYLLKEKWCRITDTFSNLSLLLSMQGSLFSYLQVFIPETKDSIALEPISSLTNSFNRKEFGLIVLKPGEKRSGSVTIELAYSKIKHSLSNMNIQSLTF